MAKAEYLEGKENPRFVVTNLASEPWPAQSLYGQLNCQRGEIQLAVALERLRLFAGLEVRDLHLLVSVQQGQT